MADRVLHSTIDVEVRNIDEKSRSAEFVASTENPVQTWGDPEVLRMGGCDLTRYRKNPVLLDTHKRYDLSSVIGSCDVRIDGTQMIATARYAMTKSGQEAWDLVKDKHVRAMSIGYSVDPKSVTRLKEGQREGDVTGPATIANKWKLLEISNVPVPADEDAVRRSFYESIEPKEAPVADANVPAGSLISRAVAMSETPAPAPVAQPQAPAPQAQPAGASYTARELHKRDVMAITPPGLERQAADCILRGLDLEQTRAELLKAQGIRFTPIGTPEVPASAAPQPDAARALDAMSDDDLVRALENIR